MKKIVMLTAFVFMVAWGAEAQVVVKVRPATPVVVRPACPSLHHIWVGGSWKWNHKTNSYAWVDGYWARPRRHNAYWVEGHWHAARGGWKYVPGHWS